MADAETVATSTSTVYIVQTQNAPPQAYTQWPVAAAAIFALASQPGTAVTVGTLDVQT